MSDYLAARGRKEKVSVHGFGFYREGFLERAKRAGVPATATELEGELSEAFDDGRWKSSAAYPSFKPERDEPSSAKEPSKAFRVLVEDYRVRYRALPSSPQSGTGRSAGGQRQIPPLVTVPVSANCEGLLNQL